VKAVLLFSVNNVLNKIYSIFYSIMPNCSLCDKPLKSIGYARKNGKSHADWDTRTLHKKCWLETKEREKYDNFILRFKNYNI